MGRMKEYLINEHLREEEKGRMKEYPINEHLREGEKGRMKEYPINEHLREEERGKCEAAMRYFPEKKENESDPNGLSQHEPGAKLDSGKVLGGLLGDFSLALMEVLKVGTFGANKYTRKGWENVPNGYRRYTDAMWRHLLQEEGEERDTESGLYHQAHLAWNALARLEIMLRESDGG